MLTNRPGHAITLDTSAAIKQSITEDRPECGDNREPEAQYRGLWQLNPALRARSPPGAGTVQMARYCRRSAAWERPEPPRTAQASKVKLRGTSAVGRPASSLDGQLAGQEAPGQAQQPQPHTEHWESYRDRHHRYGLPLPPKRARILKHRYGEHLTRLDGENQPVDV